jgi:hypothetical protein
MCKGMVLYPICCFGPIYGPKPCQNSHFSAKPTFSDTTSMSIDPVTLILVFSDLALPIGLHIHVFMPNLRFLAYLWPKNLVEIAHFSAKSNFCRHHFYVCLLGDLGFGIF